MISFNDMRKFALRINSKPLLMDYKTIFTVRDHKVRLRLPLLVCTANSTLFEAESASLTSPLYRTLTPAKTISSQRQTFARCMQL